LKNEALVIRSEGEVADYGLMNKGALIFLQVGKEVVEEFGEQRVASFQAAFVRQDDRSEELVDEVGDGKQLVGRLLGYGKLEIWLEQFLRNQGPRDNEVNLYKYFWRLVGSQRIPDFQTLLVVSNKIGSSDLLEKL